jgi:hypothetical protein
MPFINKLITLAARSSTGAMRFDWFLAQHVFRTVRNTALSYSFRSHQLPCYLLYGPNYKSIA